MRSVTQTRLVARALVLIGALVPFATHGEEADYRLLELDGHKVKWGEQELGAGATVTYAVAAASLRFDDARNCQQIRPMEALTGEDLPMSTVARETEAAFQVWERVADLTFHQVDDAEQADIVIGAQGQPRGRAYANVSYAPAATEGIRPIDQALVCLNPEHAWKVGFGGDDDAYDIGYTLIHEIGHTIGLDHPGPSGQVMAFRYTEAFDELQPGDLRGVRRLYGRGGAGLVLGGPRDATNP